MTGDHHRWGGGGGEEEILHYQCVHICMTRSFQNKLQSEECEELQMKKQIALYEGFIQQDLI